jgi:hypothetical protein
MCALLLCTSSSSSRACVSVLEGVRCNVLEWHNERDESEEDNRQERVAQYARRVHEVHCANY